MSKIVLIEDCPVFARYVKEILRAYEVEHFSNPLDSFSMIGSADLILLDYKLPNMDGIEYLEFLRNNFPDIAVIMITGYGSEDLCVKALRLGVRDYIKKPFSVADLRNAVKAYVRQEEKTAPGSGVASGARVDPEILNTLFMVKNYIDNNIETKLELDTILKIACMSKTTFNKYFKAQFGMTFKEYYLRKKIARAKELLQQGVPISVVAQSLGFSYLSHFNRIFKKVEGLPPSRFACY